MCLSGTVLSLLRENGNACRPIPPCTYDWGGLKSEPAPFKHVSLRVFTDTLPPGSGDAAGELPFPPDSGPTRFSCPASKGSWEACGHPLYDAIRKHPPPMLHPSSPLKTISRLNMSHTLDQEAVGVNLRQHTAVRRKPAFPHTPSYGEACGFSGGHARSF